MPAENSAIATVAREFAEWYTTNDERMANLVHEAGFVSVTSKLAGAEDLPDLVAGFADQAEDGVLLPSTEKMSAVWAPYNDAVIDSFNEGGITHDRLETAAHQIRDQW